MEMARTTKKSVETERGRPPLERGVDLAGFIEAHYRRLLGLLTLRTGDRDIAEELAQESVIKLVQHWDRVSQMENPWAWLVTVAMNQSRSRWRRLKMSARLARDTAQPEELAAGSEDLAVLMLVIAGLPKRQRMALVFRHYAHFSVDETAEAMKCAPGTVKALTFQAIQQLRDELGEEIDHAND